MKQPFVIACLFFLFACTDQSKNKQPDEEATTLSTSTDTVITMPVKTPDFPKTGEDTVSLCFKLN